MNSLLDLLARQIDVRSERCEYCRPYRGAASRRLKLLDAQKDVSDLQMQRERLVAELGSAKHNIVQTEAEGTNRWRIAALIQRELAGIEEEINQQRTIVEAAEKMIAAL